MTAEFGDANVFVKELTLSLLDGWANMEVAEGVAPNAVASEGVGLTDGFPKLKPVDTEGWPKPEVADFGWAKSEVGRLSPDRGFIPKVLVKGEDEAGAAAPKADLGGSSGMKSESGSSSGWLSSAWSVIWSSIWLS